MATYLGHSIIWDAENNKVLCEFDKSGRFTTQDERIMKILDSKNYIVEDRYDEIVIIEDDPVETEEDLLEYVDNVAIGEQHVEELKAHCKEQGYRGYGNIQDVEKLVEFIQKREGD